MHKQEANPLSQDLRDEFWEKRFLALKRICSEPGKSVFSKLTSKKQDAIIKIVVSLLEDSDYRVRSQAAVALGVLKREETRDFLITALADPHDWVRVQVADALGKVGDSRAAQIVAQHLHSEEDAHVRATLIQTLGNIGDEKMLPVLALYLEDSDSRVRANCVEAVSRLKISEASLKTALLKLVNDPSNRVRANIAISLLSIGEEKGREILEKMLVSKDEFMRASATYALGEVRESGDKSRLIELLADSSLLVRKNAVRSLVKHGIKILPQVVPVLSSSDPAVKIGALEVIKNLKDLSARQAVIMLLEDENGEVRSKAEEVLDSFSGF